MVRNRRKKPSLGELADAAFEQAARKVIEVAKQTGTPIIVWRDGRIVKIPAEDFELPPPKARN